MKFEKNVLRRNATDMKLCFQVAQYFAISERSYVTLIQFIGNTGVGETRTRDMLAAFGSLIFKLSCWLGMYDSSAPPIT